MGPFRVLQISIVILMLFGSTWLVRTAGMEPSSAGPSTSWLEASEALWPACSSRVTTAITTAVTTTLAITTAVITTAVITTAVITTDGNNNDNGSDDNDNFDDFDLPPLPPLPSSSRPEHAPDPGLHHAWAGGGLHLARREGFAADLPEHAQAGARRDLSGDRLPLGAAAARATSSGCSPTRSGPATATRTPLEELPAEANLGIRYSDLEATGLDESRFVIGRLNMATGTWTPVEKLGNDPSSNYTSATIIQTGFYMVWEAR